MVVEIKRHICTGQLLKWLVGAGLVWLEYNVDQVNRMNVFPVPDGDTGTNMLLTMRKAYGEISHLNEDHVGIVADGIAKGALMGARGNSGVILSQIWYGFAKTLKGHEYFDAALFARACESAIDAAYKAVVKPVEGTILTVAREAGEEVIARAGYQSDLTALLEIMVEAAQKSLTNTPELLPLLKQAGVVDSGGMGLTYILEGMLRFLRGEVVPMDTEKAIVDGQNWQQAIVPEDEEGYGYDVQFLMRGKYMDVGAVRTAIDAMGWSTLVVGDEKLIKVHVHVHDPGKPISYAIGLGAALDDVVVENMQQQYEEYVEERIARESGEGNAVEGVGVIAVASGEGMRHLFLEDLNAASVVTGGQTMNPSTEDFLAAIDKLPNDEIVLLPNNKNIILAAKQAASMCPGKNIQVVSTRTLPQGISAMLAYMNARESDASMEDIVADMQEAINSVTSCEVTIATRSVSIDGVDVEEGQVIGLLDGKLVISGATTEEVVLGLLRKAHAEDAELVTIYYGNDVTMEQVEQMVDKLSAEFARQEFVVVNGGQPLYPYIISVE
jgi:DAK2 domain fusion protein YloV